YNQQEIPTHQLGLFQFIQKPIISLRNFFILHVFLSNQLTDYYIQRLIIIRFPSDLEISLIFTLKCERKAHLYIFQQEDKYNDNCQNFIQIQNYQIKQYTFWQSYASSYIQFIICTHFQYQKIAHRVILILKYLILSNLRIFRFQRILNLIDQVHFCIENLMKFFFYHIFTRTFFIRTLTCYFLNSIQGLNHFYNLYISIKQCMCFELKNFRAYTSISKIQA
ncbi:hypothetical protein IMG5_183980, partial [Ichthyophthirius multifiliis]